MDPVVAQYEAIGRKEVLPPVDYNEYKRLLAHARKFQRSEDEDARLMAVSVCGAIGGQRGMYEVRQFLRHDDSLAVRRRCVQVALEDGETGLTILRAALEDADEELVLEALGWLRRASDRGSAGALRKLVRHDSPRVRRAAAELVGHIAGPGMATALRPLQSDADEAVRQAADEAVRRLDGELPQDPPDPWWLADMETAWEAPEPVALPDPLPDSIEDLLRALAQVADGDRQAVLTALTEGYSMSELGRAVRKTAPNGDRALNVGAALAGRLLERRDWLVALRRLLPDDDPWVRITVAETMGVIGASSVVMGVKQLLEAPQPAVRAAAIRALDKLCDARERERYLSEIAGDDAAEVVEALEQVRGEDA